MATVALLLLSLVYYYAYGQTTEQPLDAVNLTEGRNCIPELDVITSEPIHLNLSNPSNIPANYSVATSVSYHKDTSTILIGGDFFYIDPENTKNRTYYQFYSAYNHTKDNKFSLKYQKYYPFTNAKFGNKFISHQSLRSWTRIIAHPSLPYFYLVGINNLTAYNVDTGDLKWTATITQCSSKSPDRPIIYNDVTFFYQDNNNLYVGGSCINDTGKTVIVVDKYSVEDGTWDKDFRLRWNLTELGFFKDVNILDGFGLIPPEVTIKAPVGPVINTSVEDKYFFVGFSHVMFSGMARIEYDYAATPKPDWRVKKWPDHWTLVNPSFVVHRNLVTTNDGLMALLDPSLNGLISLFVGKMKHVIAWKTRKFLGQIDEDKIYDGFTWYGGHEKYDLHLDWTLSIDPLSDYQDAYVTASPLELPSVKKSTIAKHDVKTGEVTGGAKVPFYALDSIVTNDGQLVTVGFKWTPSMKDGFNIKNFSLSDILPYFERKAVFQVYNSTIEINTCIGCKVDYYTTERDGQCGKKCDCENGYCNDDIDGDGTCYCTIMSYGEHCRACDGLFGSCDPLKGLCNSGPDGDGKCKFCYDLDLETDPTFNISFGLGDHYGPECNDNCTCNTDYGICYTTGNDSDERAGECIYCTHSNVFGPNCDTFCNCDKSKEYCSNGITGTGCVAYDYGGLLKNKGWGFYTSWASALFVFFFTVTYLQTNKQYKEQHDGESLPWCPKREKKDDDDDEKERDEYYNKRQNVNNNDLNERMLNGNGNGNGIQNQQINLIDDNDPNEPPVSSHMINDGNGVIEQEQEQDDEQQRYDI